MLSPANAFTVYLHESNQSTLAVIKVGVFHRKSPFVKENNHCHLDHEFPLFPVAFNTMFIDQEFYAYVHIYFFFFLKFLSI